MASIRSHRYNDPIVTTNGKSTSGVNDWKFKFSYAYIGADSYWHEVTETVSFRGTYKFAKSEMLKVTRMHNPNKIELID